MKPLFLLAPLGAILLAGCAQNATQRDFSSAPRDVAASYISARAFDSAQVALRDNDTAKLRRAANDLRLAAARGNNARLSAAFVQLVAQSAVTKDLSASSLPLEARNASRQRAEEKYRIALSALPRDYQLIWELQLDANTLNTLGYFLAEHGKNVEEFRLAEFLTSASLAKWDELLKEIGVDDPRWVSAHYLRAVTAGDSRAWALFRLKRYPEAERAMREVLQVTTDYGPQLGEPLSPELPFHMAEILRAQGKTEEAEIYYQKALELNPDAELRAKIQSLLEGKIG